MKRLLLLLTGDRVGCPHCHASLIATPTLFARCPECHGVMRLRAHCQR